MGRPVRVVPVHRPAHRSAGPLDARRRSRGLRRRGRLMLRAVSPIPVLYRGFARHPDDEKDPYVSRIDLAEFGIGSGRVVFTLDPAGTSTRIHLDLVPLS